MEFFTTNYRNVPEIPSSLGQAVRPSLKSNFWNRLTNSEQYLLDVRRVAQQQQRQSQRVHQKLKE